MLEVHAELVVRHVEVVDATPFLDPLGYLVDDVKVADGEAIVNVCHEVASLGLADVEA